MWRAFNVHMLDALKHHAATLSKDTNTTKPQRRCFQARLVISIAIVSPLMKRTLLQPTTAKIVMTQTHHLRLRKTIINSLNNGVCPSLSAESLPCEEQNESSGASLSSESDDLAIFDKELDPDAALEIFEKLATNLDHPETIQLGIAHMKALPDHIQKVEKQFNQIREKLDQLASAQPKWDVIKMTRLGTWTLIAKWDKLFESFLNLVQISRDSASKITGFIEAYQEILPKEPGKITYERLAKEIKALLDSTTDALNEIKIPQNGFTKLARNIKVYTRRIDVLIEAIGSSEYQDDLQKELQSKREELEEVKSQIDSLQSKVHALGKRALLNFVAGAAAGGSLAMTLSPEAFSAALIAGLSLLHNGGRYLHTKYKISKLEKHQSLCESQLKVLEERFENLPNYLELLSNARVSMDDIACRLNSISGAWSHFRSDLIKLETSLNVKARSCSNQAEDERCVDQISVDQFKNTRILYKFVHTMLEVYTKNVRLETLPDNRKNGINWLPKNLFP